MNAKPTDSTHKVLVTVFDDVGTAKNVVEGLHSSGFPLDKIELVVHDPNHEAPEVETPKVHETTGTSLIGGATRWAGVGAATGVIASVFAPFPGLGLAMIVMGGVTGAIVGGISGVTRAAEDDSVNLPTLEEYEQLVRNGQCLVVVLGNHEELMRAEAIVKNLPHVRSHIHPVHGHEFHEHPAHPKNK